MYLFEKWKKRHNGTELYLKFNHEKISNISSKNMIMGCSGELSNQKNRDPDELF